MSNRHFANLIDAYVEYSSFTESSEQMRYWSGVTALAGALRGRVYIDQRHFKWIPNFYVIFSVNPGSTHKATVAETALNLLGEVPGVNFGSAITETSWKTLTKLLADKKEEYIDNEGKNKVMSSITWGSFEFTVPMRQPEKTTLDLLNWIWDGKRRECVNILGYATLGWIAENFTKGFTERCIIIRADESAKSTPYFGLSNSDSPKRNALLKDLEHISLNLCGEYSLTKEAVAWGDQWYKDNIFRRSPNVEIRQSHIHKLAIIIAASKRDKLVVSSDDLKEAEKRISDLHVPVVVESVCTDRLVRYVKHHGTVSYEDAYRYIDIVAHEGYKFNDISGKAEQLGLIQKVMIAGKPYFKYEEP